MSFQGFMRTKASVHVFQCKTVQRLISKTGQKPIMLMCKTSNLFRLFLKIGFVHLCAKDHLRMASVH